MRSPYCSSSIVLLYKENCHFKWTLDIYSTA